MFRIAQTHKKIVRPNFDKTKRPDSWKEETTSIEETISSGKVISGDSKEIGSSKSSRDSRVLYNYAFGVEVPQSEGVVVPWTLPNLVAIDYGELPLLGAP